MDDILDVRDNKLIGQLLEYFCFSKYGYEVDDLVLQSELQHLQEENNLDALFSDKCVNMYMEKEFLQKIKNKQKNKKNEYFK